MRSGAQQGAELAALCEPGAFFGTTFPHLLFQTYPPPSTLPAPQADPQDASKREQTTPLSSLSKVYVPRIYGFKVSERARSGPRMQWMRMRVRRGPFPLRYRLVLCAAVLIRSSASPVHSHGPRARSTGTRTLSMSTRQAGPAGQAARARCSTTRTSTRRTRPSRKRRRKRRTAPPAHRKEVPPRATRWSRASPRRWATRGSRARAPRPHLARRPPQRRRRRRACTRSAPTARSGPSRARRPRAPRRPTRRLLPLLPTRPPRRPRSRPRTTRPPPRPLPPPPLPPPPGLSRPKQPRPRSPRRSSDTSPRRRPQAPRRSRSQARRSPLRLAVARRGASARGNATLAAPRSRGDRRSGSGGRCERWRYIRTRAWRRRFAVLCVFGSSLLFWCPTRVFLPLLVLSSSTCTQGCGIRLFPQQPDPGRQG